MTEYLIRISLFYSFNARPDAVAILLLTSIGLEPKQNSLKIAGFALQMGQSGYLLLFGERVGNSVCSLLDKVADAHKAFCNTAIGAMLRFDTVLTKCFHVRMELDNIQLYSGLFSRET